MSYLDNKNDELKEYFKILCNGDFPDWLWEYVDTPEMQRIDKISISCGMDYFGCFDINYFYSNLDHSIGVALIIWNFTHDKKQTLAGLFHDIATPTFKHCIDFMNGDSETQESTEELTTVIIKNSKEIMALLERDGIRLEEVDDYKKYPIADNDTPRLSADRFEYTFSSGLTFFRVWDLDKIKKMYQNIIVVKNEDGLDELAFKDKEVCEEYISIISNLWPEWVSDSDRIGMQFIADMCKSMKNAGYLSIEDLYNLSEQEVINKILNCNDSYLSESFKKFMQTTQTHSSSEKVDGKYCVNVRSKTRYVNPLVIVNGEAVRISDTSFVSNELISNYLKIPKEGFVYLDFNFKPYGIDFKSLDVNFKKISMQDIYYKVNSSLVNDDFYSFDVDGQKRLVELELKKYIISKIHELDLNIDVNNNMDIYFLVDILGRMIPSSKHFDVIRHLTHYMLQIAGTMQGWEVIWFVEEDNSLIDKPLVSFNESDKWDKLITHQETDLVYSFKFTYDIFKNHFMEKQNVKIIEND